MSTTANKLLSFAEFETLPSAPGKQELLHGELIKLPPARHSHMEIAKAIYALFQAVLDRSRVHMEAGYQIGDRTWLQPDVSVSWPDQKLANDYPQGAPLIAVEIVSPSNSAEDIDRKIAAYLDGGAQEVWVIYPRTQSMVIHQSGSTRRIPAQDVYTSSAVPGLDIRLSEILST